MYEAHFKSVCKEILSVEQQILFSEQWLYISSSVVNAIKLGVSQKQTIETYTGENNGNCLFTIWRQNMKIFICIAEVRDIFDTENLILKGHLVKIHD